MREGKRVERMEGKMIEGRTEGRTERKTIREWTEKKMQVGRMLALRMPVKMARRGCSTSKIAII